MRTSLRPTLDDRPETTLIEAVIPTKLCQVGAMDHRSTRGDDRERSPLHSRHVLFLKVGGRFAKKRMFLAFRETIPVRVSALGLHILHVVGLRALKQMVQTQAPRIVAVMQDIKPRVHRAVYLFRVGFSMRPVSGPINSSGPVPTALGFIDLLPKHALSHEPCLSLRRHTYNYAVIG